MINFGTAYDWNSDPISDRGDGMLADLLARRPSEDQATEASIRWGGPSSFRTQMVGIPLLPVVNVVNWPEFPGGENPDDEDDENEDQPTFDYQEIARTTSDVRVENPDDAEQYVIVRRVETATFRGADGKIIRLIFANGDGSA